MNWLDRSFRSLTLFAGFMLSGYGQCALAQDADDAEEGVQPAANRAFVMSDEQFDQWVFGGPSNSHGNRGKLDSLLILEVDDVGRWCGLSESQKKKLILAGRGDIKRFYDEVEEKRKEFDKVKTDQQKAGAIYQELAPLRTKLNSGLFGDGSIYAKMLNRLLSEEQQRRYAEVVRERRRFRYRAKIELAVAHLEQQTVGFSDEQRGRIVEIILKETPPPARFGNYDYYYVLYQAGKISNTKIKSLLDEKQWGFVDRQLKQMGGIEQFLINQGLLKPKNEDRRRIEPVGRAVPPPGERSMDLPENVFAPAPGERGFQTVRQSEPDTPFEIR
jgi:hypothetical protein